MTDSMYIEDYHYEPEGTVNQYEDCDLTGVTKIVDAKYIKSPNPDLNGNPFVEALPQMREIEDLIMSSERGQWPFDRGKETAKKITDQLMNVERLNKLRFFLPVMQQLDREEARVLAASYSQRRLLVDQDNDLPFNLHGKENASTGILLGCEADGAECGFAMIGYSGCGKSSTMGSILSYYPQVILHHGVNGKIFPQIVYLYLTASPGSNFSSLYQAIGKAIDDALGNTAPEYAAALSGGKNIGTKTQLLCRLIERFSIGIIIIDEIQLMNFDMTQMNSFYNILTITNSTKVAFGVIGTPEANKRIFGQEIRKRRTAVPDGKKDPRIVSKYQEARRIGMQIKADTYCGNKEIFLHYLNGLYGYNWTSTPLSDELVRIYYDCSYGIIAALVTLYKAIQTEYILHEEEDPRITPEFVMKVQDKYYPGLRDIMSNMDRPDYDERFEKIMKDGKEKLSEAASEGMQRESIVKLTDRDFQKKESRENMLKARIVDSIRLLFSKYTTEQIESAFRSCRRTAEGKEASPEELSQMVMKKLKETFSGTETKKAIKAKQKSEEDTRAFVEMLNS